MSVLVNRDRQRISALVGANEMRFRNKDVKRYLKSLSQGDEANMEAAEMLRRCPKAVAGMELHVFLLAIPGVGPERLRRICQRCEIWPFRKIGRLTLGQREKVARQILVHAGWGPTRMERGRNG
ncbi:MAG: hypothetical protein KGL39_38560 [Patescibacteria group bacterium]|nr:hypothetical protein [Patescibacteria group bacterium]